ncbi:MAG: putative holin-like toxin [Lachnospiraceae bacterium]|nr:putative holin-like toxin [Lachnospiraceae bacterium]
MSTYEVMTLLFLSGTFLIALLAYLDNRNERKPTIPLQWNCWLTRSRQMQASLRLARCECENKNYPILVLWRSWIG